MSAPHGATTSVDFGDGSSSQAGELGAMQCMPKTALAPFNDTFAGYTHTYAKPGTYTVTGTTTICGDNGPSTTTVTKTITIK